MKLFKFSLSLGLVLLCLCLVSARSSKRRNRIVGKYVDGLGENRYFVGSNKDRKCGYEGCPKSKPNMLNVHIVAHTHDDVGWLKTVDQYYYGSKSTIQKAGVQYILDSVVQELLADPQKRFIYVESAFFFKWWNEQSNELQDKVKVLVNEGRLEFIGGAWTMNDEATTNYQSTIDQFTWGLRKLNDTFGECGRPRVGWQIDPFGHSREQASLFAQMGYDGVFLGRVDYQDKDNRFATKSMEMIWEGSPNLGDKADLFTGVLFNNYSPPPGFCFDILCSDEPIIDNKRSADYNVQQKVDAFFEYVKNMTKVYQSNNVLITMGEDFNYQDARMWFKNLDKLIFYANERQLNDSNINLFYSTPSCYLKSLRDSAVLNWPAKTDDFFPYGSDPHAYWTGYFSSRPTIKRFERVGNHFLQVCKQLSALAPTKAAHLVPHLTLLREAMGMMQHHDAITGTEKQHVADDYARILNQAMEACGANTQDVLNQLTTGKNSIPVGRHQTYDREYDFSFSSCPNLNISKCDVSESSENFIVTLYNPLPRSTFQYIRIPVTGQNYSIKDYRGVPTQSQIVPIPEQIQNINYRFSNASYELVFMANELPPLGYKSYFISKGTATEEPSFDEVDCKRTDPHAILLADQPNLNEDNATILIGNKYINLTFTKNGHLINISSNGATSNVAQKFFYYKGASGDNREFINRSSGAYIFRPNGTIEFVKEKIVTNVIIGPVVQEIHQVYSDWLSQVIRVYKDENFAEFEWLVGEIPIDDGFGKEIYTSFVTDINSNGIFETDSNGREMIKRVRSHRDTWKVNLKEPIAGNYYPVTSKIAIEDSNVRLAIMTDRAQGGSSLDDGSIDLMIHRRLLHDDAFGVDEALNETAYGKGLIVRGQHYLTVGATKTPSPSMKAQERFIQLKKLIPNWIFVSDASKYTFEEWQKTYTHIFSGLSLSLPQNVNLLTLEPWRDDSILVRFEHILEKNEDSEYSKPATFNLKDIFHNFDISELQETTLSANQWKDSAHRFSFRKEAPKNVDTSNVSDEKLQMTINLDSTKIENIRPYVHANKTTLDEHMATSLNGNSDVDGILMANVNYNGANKQSRLYEKSSKDLFTISLNPMEIRTFVITLEWRP